MNTETPAGGARFPGVPYLNGGLFADMDPIELNPAEISTLAEAGDFDRSRVKPEIFGTLFRSSMNADEHHAFDLPSPGAGECPIMAIAPAIGDAIFAATGKRLRGLRCSGIETAAVF